MVDEEFDESEVPCELVEDDDDAPLLDGDADVIEELVSPPLALEPAELADPQAASPQLMANAVMDPATTLKIQPDVRLIVCLSCMFSFFPMHIV